jgi:hypothetical protein
MITEEDITFEDRRPFHKIKMYKDLMSNFISINIRTEIANHNKISLNCPLIGSFPKLDLFDESYKTCNDDMTVKHGIDFDNSAYECIYSSTFNDLFLLDLKIIFIF